MCYCTRGDVVVVNIGSNLCGACPTKIIEVSEVQLFTLP